MVQSILPKPLPRVYHNFDDQILQDFNNTCDLQDEDLIKVCIEEVYQSFKGISKGSLHDSSASSQDLFTECTKTISGMQEIDNTTVINKNLPQNFTNNGNFQLIPENSTNAEDAVSVPMQGENEDDLEKISELFLMEDPGKLDSSNSQAISNKSQEKGVKTQAKPRAVQKNTAYGSSLLEITPNHGRWNQDEHRRFLRGVKLYGRQWGPISLLVRTRNPIQVRTHAQKHFLNDPYLEELSKRPELRPAKRKRSGGCEGTSSDGTFGTASNSLNHGRWSEHEHDLFIQGIQEHGRNWAKVTGLVQSRTVLQVRSHAQKHFKKIEESRKKATI